MTFPTASRTKRNPHLFFTAGEASSAPGLRCTKCLRCGQHAVGAIAACAACLGRELEIVAAGHEATIVDTSVVHNPAADFAAPYTIATLRTGEGMTLFAPLVGAPEEMAPGVHVIFELIEHADGTVGFAYRVDGE